MYLNPRLWAFTRGVRLRIAGTTLAGLLAVLAGIARLALLGWVLGRVLAGDSLATLAWPRRGRGGPHRAPRPCSSTRARWSPIAPPRASSAGCAGASSTRSSRWARPGSPRRAPAASCSPWSTASSSSRSTSASTCRSSSSPRCTPFVIFAVHGRGGSAGRLRLAGGRDRHADADPRPPLGQPPQPRAPEELRGLRRGVPGRDAGPAHAGRVRPEPVPRAGCSRSAARALFQSTMWVLGTNMLTRGVTDVGIALGAAVGARARRLSRAGRPDGAAPRCWSC